MRRAFSFAVVVVMVGLLVTALYEYWMIIQLRTELERLREACGLGVQIGVMFYTWYEGGKESVSWENITDRPLVHGWYDSENETVIKYQLEALKECGFDFILISLGEENSKSWNATKKVFEVLDESGIDLYACVLYEPAGNWQNYESRMNSIYGNFTEPYHYLWFKYQGSPLLVSFNDAKPPKSDARFTVRWAGHNKDWIDWTFWAYPLPEVSNGGAFIIGRYDDRACWWKSKHQIYDADMSKGTLELQTDYVIQHLDELDIIVFYGWNEYGERCNIEPHYDHSGVAPFEFYNRTKVCLGKIRVCISGYNYEQE